MALNHIAMFFERNITLKELLMKLYLAPMEGITTYIYRNAYAHYFGGS